MSQKAQNIIPSLTGFNTKAQVNEQGYTYNQPGFTYNQSGVDYGGVYNVGQDIIPSISLAKDTSPKLTGSRTQAQLEEQGYTYNQSGFGYNQPGAMYAGVYNYDQDVFPTVSNIDTHVPLIASFADIYTTFIPPSGKNQSIGPGFFMFITQ